MKPKANIKYKKQLKKGGILDCAGLWSDINDKDAKEMEEAIMKMKKLLKKGIKL